MCYSFKQQSLFCRVRGSTLFAYLSEKTEYTEATATRYTCQLLSALRWLHCRNQAHLDVKPENVLIDHEMDQIKVIDLGEAVRAPIDEIVPPPADLEFAAPESVLGRPTGPYTDMWAVGVFIYVLLRYFSEIVYLFEFITTYFSLLHYLLYYIRVLSVLNTLVECRHFWTTPWRKPPPTFSNAISVFPTNISR